MPLSPGDKFGPYTLLDRLGSGGMGEVWKGARHTARPHRRHQAPAQRACLPYERSPIPEGSPRDRSVESSHICQIYGRRPGLSGAGIHRGQAVWSRRNRPTQSPLDDAIKIALQIASALEEAHGRGITHRDLKPDNILKTRTGVKVLDFGLAKLSADADVTKSVEGTVMGTAAYNVAGAGARQSGRRALRYFFLRRRALRTPRRNSRAFTGDSMAAVLGAVLTADPAPFDAPPALARVVTTCLRKSPADRFQNIAEVKKLWKQIAVKAEPEKPQPSIAVLPFRQHERDKENEYFSDGLAEEILNLLAKIPEPEGESPRTSSFSFRGKEQDIRKIAENARREPMCWKAACAARATASASPRS